MVYHVNIQRFHGKLRYDRVPWYTIVYTVVPKFTIVSQGVTMVYHGLPLYDHGTTAMCYDHVLRHRDGGKVKE